MRFYSTTSNSFSAPSSPPAAFHLRAPHAGRGADESAALLSSPTPRQLEHHRHPSAKLRSSCRNGRAWTRASAAQPRPLRRRPTTTAGGFRSDTKANTTTSTRLRASCAQAPRLSRGAFTRRQVAISAVLSQSRFPTPPSPSPLRPSSLGRWHNLLLALLFEPFFTATTLTFLVCLRVSLLLNNANSVARKSSP